MSWNIAHRPELWSAVFAAADTHGVDIALIQEAPPPPPDLAHLVIPASGAPWETAGHHRRDWRTALVSLSPALELRHIQEAGIESERPGVLSVSRPGTLTLGRLSSQQGIDVNVVSMYAPWERALSPDDVYISADASAHRLLSDLSPFVTGRQTGSFADVPLIAAGDLNILHGQGERGSTYWRDRYQTFFDRAEALGLTFVGPQAPEGGRRVGESFWPERELPRSSLNVPTFHPVAGSPESATRQLDFVFASRSIAERVSARALNGIEDWGPSDHCRVLIDFQP